MHRVIARLCVNRYVVVVRRALEVFACAAGADGVYALRADPSIRCWEQGGAQLALVPWAVASLVLYGAGIPVSIGCTLWALRDAIRRDQHLWLAGRGETPDTNNDISVRRRFAKLYQVRETSCLRRRATLPLIGPVCACASARTMHPTSACGAWCCLCGSSAWSASSCSQVRSTQRLITLAAAVTFSSSCCGGSSCMQQQQQQQ